MLTEKVFKELVRDSSLQNHLIESAWPDLSTESRLQIVHQIVTTNSFSQIPVWLGNLCLRDSAQIVRFWGARYMHFRRPSELTLLNKTDTWLDPEHDKKLELYAIAKADTSPLVTTCADAGSTLSFKSLNKVSQLERLVFIRTLEFPHLNELIDWLESAIKAEVPDEELLWCALEFFRLPQVQQDLTVTDFDDGLDAHFAG